MRYLRVRKSWDDNCPTWHSLSRCLTRRQPGDDGSAADAIARTPNRRRATSQRGLPATHSQAGDVALRPDAADAARDAHAGDASDAPAPQQLAAVDARARPGRDVALRQDAEHAAVDARARAVFFARSTKPGSHARRPLGLKVGGAVPALGADDAPILRAVGAGVAEF